MKKPSKVITIFLSVFIVSFALRALFLSSCLFNFDSVTLASAVERTIQEGKLQYDHSYSYLNVLMNVILAIVFKLIGISSIETILKLNNIMFISLSCAFLFLAVLNLTKKTR